MADTNPLYEQLIALPGQAVASAQAALDSLRATQAGYATQGAPTQAHVLEQQAIQEQIQSAQESVRQAEFQQQEANRAFMFQTTGATGYSGSGPVNDQSAKNAAAAANAPVGSLEWWAAQIAGREAAARANATPGQSQQPGQIARGAVDGIEKQISDAFTTYYAPKGDRAQIELQNTKAAYDKISGELAFYQVPMNPYTGQPRTGVYGAEAGGILIGGGGRGAAQSGMFSQGVALTPDVVTQYNPSKYSEQAMPQLAEMVRANPQAYSRLGAEAYQGIVQPLDNRTIESSRAVYGRFPAWTGNMANLVDPYGVNVGKAQYPGANIPWSIPLNAPNLMIMDRTGIVGASPVQAYNPEASMGYAGPLWGVGSRNVGINKQAPPDTLIIGEPGGTRYGPSIVGMKTSPVQEQVVGSDTFLADRVGILPTTPEGVERGLAEGSIKKPFISAIAIADNPTNIKSSVSDQLIGSSQYGLRTSLASLPGGIGLAIASDTAFGIASGQKENIPFYDLIHNVTTPYSQPVGTVTKEQYETNLAKYNLELSQYQADQLDYESGRKTQPEFEKLQSAYSNLQREQTVLESQQKNIVNPPTTLERIGSIYESLNTGLAPYTTDIAGIGKTLSKTPDIDMAKYGDTSGLPYGDIINVAKGVYVGASQHPVDITLTYAGGSILGLGERVVAGGVARAAMGEIPVLSRVPGVATAGRALSTPTASDIVTIGKAAVGGYLIYEAGTNIIIQPTAAKAGEAAGRTAIQFGGFGAGTIKGDIATIPGETPNRFSTVVSRYNDYIRSTPTNEFTGKGFFSGKQEMGAIERAIYNTRVELLARSQPTEEQATIIRAAGQLGGSAARFNEAPLKAEPRFEEASALGKDYGPLIKGVAADKSNPTITKGSMVVGSQYPESTISEAGIRSAHDWDALAFDVGAKFEAIATESRIGDKVPTSKQFASAQEVMASGIADIRPIPEPYPGFTSSVSPDVRPSDAVPLSLIERIMGNPFSKIVGPRGTSEVLISGKTVGYSGTTNAEAAQAQFGRKVGSALKDFAEDPIGQGYRGQKDLYDVISIYRAQQITAREQGIDITKGDWAKNEAAINKMLDVTLHVGSEKGQTTGGKMINLREWYAAKEAEVRGRNIPVTEETPFLPDAYQSERGIVPPSISAASYTSGGYVGKIAASVLSPQSDGSSRSASPSNYNNRYGSDSPSRSSRSSPSPSLFITPSGSISPSGSPIPPGSVIGSPSDFPSPAPYPSISQPPGSPSPIYEPSPSTVPSPDRSYPPYLSPPPILSPPVVPLGSGGSHRDSRRRRRKVELFSFEIGIDTPIPIRYGLAGKTTKYIPGYRGVAADIIPAGDIAPNRLFDIGRRVNDRL